VVVDEAPDRSLAVATGVANAIREALDEGLPVGDPDAERALRPGDIAVLVRRIAVAGPVLRALLRLGVPAQVLGGEGFFGREEIMDLIAGLQLVADPADELATLTVLRSPLVAFPDAELLPLLDGIPQWKAGLSWDQVMAGVQAGGVEEGAAQRVLRLDGLLKKLRTDLSQKRLVQVLDQLIDGTDFVAATGLCPDAAARWANVHQLRRLCEGPQGAGIQRIARLWEALDDPPRLGLADTLPADLDAVRLITIHQAKGLEFPVVVLADTEAKSEAPGRGGGCAFRPRSGPCRFPPGSAHRSLRARQKGRQRVRAHGTGWGAAASKTP
jgi:ATP-dependent helicase/nuclease subunit A